MILYKTRGQQHFRFFFKCLFIEHFCIKKQKNKSNSIINAYRKTNEDLR